MKLEHHVACGSFARIGDAVRRPGPIENNAVGLDPLTQGFKFAFEQDDGDIMIVAMHCVSPAGGYHRRMAMQLVEVARGAFEQESRRETGAVRMSFEAIRNLVAGMR